MTRQPPKDEPPGSGAAADALPPDALQAVFAPMMDAIVVMGGLPAKGLPPIVYVNPAFERLSGYAAAELRGATFERLRGPGTAEEDGRRVAEVIRSRRSEAIEILNFRKDGRPYWVEASVSPFAGPNGEAWTISIERDVTGRREERERLRRAMEEARAADHAKSQFLAAMSHELRTPLNAVLGFSDMLLATPDAVPNPRHRQYLKDINVAGGHLLQLVSDILDLSQIDIERMALHRQRVPVGDVVVSCLRLVEHRAHAARLTVTIDIPGDLPAADADPLRLRQMVLNLLTNAIKFSLPGGRIGLSAAHLGDGAGDGWIEVMIADTGVGMRPEDVPRALEPFVQVDQSESRWHGGVGLGLALVKRLVDLHGGTLAIETEPGRGTTVRVRLPAAAPARDVGVTEPFPPPDAAAPRHAPSPSRGGD